MMVDRVTSAPPTAIRATRFTAPAPQESKDVAGASQPRTISLAAALAELGPPYDAARVASLKAALDDGSYRIDLGNIADAILSFGSAGNG
jgi:flagellar biosynthesis anti-sigma factor FlgM